MSTSGSAGSRRWRRALVTGASSGIGEAVARLLAEQGTDLVLVARRRERLVGFAEQLGTDHGVDVSVLDADLTAPVSLASVERRLADDSEPIDLLINNAGFGTSGQFSELPIAREQQEIELNVVALTRLSSSAIVAMTRRGGGDVLNIASVAGLWPTAGAATYGATKAYVISFSEALHEELRDTPVSVTVSLPGLTRTEFHDRLGGRPRGAPQWLWLGAEAVAAHSLTATAAGRARVVPGRRYGALVTARSLLPSRALVPLMAAARRRGRG